MRDARPTLFPFQQQGLDWLLRTPRAILADEMGMGKTVQIAALLDHLKIPHAPLNTLIIGRAALGYQWQDEFDRFHIPLRLATGLDPTTGWDLVMSEVVYTNYAKLRIPRFLNALAARRWDVIVVDEATRMKGRASAQMRGLRTLARQTERLYFLTGTPEPNGSPSEIWAWLHCIDPTTYRSFWKFVEEHCEVETWTGHPVPGKALDPEKTARSLTPVLLRRREKDVHGQLPEAQYSLVRHGLTPRQQAIYSQMQQDWLITGETTLEAQNTVARFSYLRKVVASPRLVGIPDDGGKVDAIRDLVEEAVAARRQVVVFTWHRDLADLVLDRLLEWGISAVRVYGGIASEVQHELVDTFQRGACEVLVGTIAMLAEGFNLQNASVAIFAQMSYVPADNEQAIARLVRIGQTRSVNVYTLVGTNTVEEHVWRLVREKGGARSEIEAARAALEMERAAWS